MLTAQHEGPSATAQLFARQRHIVGASRNPLQHLIMAAIYVTWVHVTPKKRARLLILYIFLPNTFAELYMYHYHIL